MLLGVTTCQLIIAVAHYITFAVYLIEGFIKRQNAHGGPLSYLENTSTPLYVAQICLTFTNVSTRHSALFEIGIWC